MRLNSIRLRNFRQHVDTFIEFSAGITGIIGPNGSGKSTILEGIAWALYGMDAARGKRDSIRSYNAPARAQVNVELDFTLGGHRYLVTRGLTNAEVYLDGAAAPIATTVSQTTEYLARRLGMTKDEFFNTYFTGQKELGVMAQMGATERGRFLSRVLGYERLRDAQDLIREKRRQLEAETKGLRAAMPDPDVVARAIADAEARLKVADKRLTSAVATRSGARTGLDQIEPRWEAMQRERETVLALVSELRVVESERASAVRDIERIDREAAEVTAARESLASITAQLAPFATLQAELRELEKASNEVARRKTLSDSLKALETELAGLVARQSELASAPELEADATQKLAAARLELADVQPKFETGKMEWARDKQEAETKRSTLLQQLRETESQREQIATLGETAPCPVCRRPLGSHMREFLDELDSSIETIKFDGKYYRQRMEQLVAMPLPLVSLEERWKELTDSVTKLDRRLIKVQSAIQELATLRRDLATKQERRASLAAELETIAVDYDSVRHSEVRADVVRLEPLGARATKLTAQIERGGAIDAERVRVGGTLARIDSRVADLTARRASIAFSEEGFGALRDQYESADAAFRAAELTAVTANAEQSAAKQEQATATKACEELAKAEVRLGELSRERRLHDELDRAFGEIRTDLNQEMRPELADRASTYIRDLTDGRYTEIDVDEQYNIIMLEDSIPKPVISGGEEDLANLVLRLAISEMIAERAGQPFSLLILDEVFGSLDETRRHNVVDLLRRLQDRFEQVILITHIDTVREGLDRVVAVRYDEESGTSRVDGENGGGPDEPQLDFQAGAAD
ncbi:MAG TPA: SMC family ATPase [Gemmatimonadaceae bacterium]|jgi:exonuclease SbcC